MYYTISIVKWSPYELDPLLYFVTVFVYFYFINELDLFLYFVLYLCIFILLMNWILFCGFFWAGPFLKSPNWIEPIFFPIQAKRTMVVRYL